MSAEKVQLLPVREIHRADLERNRGWRRCLGLLFPRGTSLVSRETGKEIVRLQTSGQPRGVRDLSSITLLSAVATDPGKVCPTCTHRTFQHREVQEFPLSNSLLTPLTLLAKSCSRCSMYWSRTYILSTGTESVSGLKSATFPRRKRSVFLSY